MSVVSSILSDTVRPTAARTLRDGFLHSVEQWGERPALEVAGERLTYAELFERSASVAATLVGEGPPEGPRLTASFAYRTPTAFVGVLAPLLAGQGYVPLNPCFPIERNRLIFERSGVRSLIVGGEALPQVEELVAGAAPGLLIVVPDSDEVARSAARLPQHRILGAGHLAEAEGWRPVDVDPGSPAYLLFTSGSTGVPKGVMVSHDNALHYVDVLTERYGITEEDRFSQMAELTFDNSVLDMFVAWERGACVCCPPGKLLSRPGRFIRESGLTVWFSVPSTAIIMRRLGMLKPGSYPTLRWSLFAGEALPAEVAAAWLEAAPNSIVENLYGPTEVTVDCTIYRWDPERSPAECEQGVVPIGRPLPDMQVLIADEQLREVGPGESGELLVAGPQVGLGYWRDPERTAQAFVIPPERREVYYRTGDRVRRPATPDGPITYLGRLDHQIKVRGIRIELGEVEAAIRTATGIDAVVALGWPVTMTGADGIVAFVGDLGVDESRTLSLLRQRLPAQMLPREIHKLAELPLNANGKFDRRELLNCLESP
jgi:amino acid adenylation domain-containing protein